jgi:hypothetical protein
MIEKETDLVYKPERCLKWSKEHDWKSCVRSKLTLGFDQISRALKADRVAKRQVAVASATYQEDKSGQCYRM